MTVDARRIKSSPASRSSADPATPAKPREDEAQKTPNPIYKPSLDAPVNRGVGQLEEEAPKVVDSIGDDAARTPADRDTNTNGQADRPDQEKNSKKKIDLSRLQKRLGPKHAALIDALKHIDPETPLGQELASIIARLDASSDSQGAGSPEPT